MNFLVSFSVFHTFVELTIVLGFFCFVFFPTSDYAIYNDMLNASTLKLKQFIIRRFPLQDSLTVNPETVVSKQKCFDYIEKWPVGCQYWVKHDSWQSP